MVSAMQRKGSLLIFLAEYRGQLVLKLLNRYAENNMFDIETLPYMKLEGDAPFEYVIAKTIGMRRAPTPQWWQVSLVEQPDDEERVKVYNPELPNGDDPELVVVSPDDFMINGEPYSVYIMTITGLEVAPLNRFLSFSEVSALPGIPTSEVPDGFWEMIQDAGERFSLDILLPN